VPTARGNPSTTGRFFIIDAMEKLQELEDVLAYLPCSRIMEYRKRAVIYEPTNPSTGLHVIIGGKVLVQRTTADGAKLVMDIYQTDDLFGETVFIGLTESHETATALELTRLMTWTGDEIERYILERPRLAFALLQVLTKRCMEYAQRIESCAAEKLEQRLARTLLYFSERLGQMSEDGKVQMLPLSHDLLAQYVGTSREIVTSKMIQFHQLGALSYSRKEIVLDPDAIKKFLKPSD
jgi:CRP-like cAMP-binding protein